MWQSDNDDDGNRGVRINYVMQHGNYGYTDEMTGAGWNQYYLGQPARNPAAALASERSGRRAESFANRRRRAVRHHDQRRRSACRGVFHDQIIHADAGPSIVRRYPVDQ